MTYLLWRLRAIPVVLLPRQMSSSTNTRKLVLGLAAFFAISLIWSVIDLYGHQTEENAFYELESKDKIRHVFKRHSERCQVRNLLGTDITSYDDKAEYLHCSRIIYNRVPKCGSRTVIATLKSLSKQRNFHVHAEARGPTSRLGKNILDDLALNISKLEEPFIYTRHVHYIDMMSYGHLQPLYINVVRDPIERLISQYYYNIYGSPDRLKQGINQSIVLLDECWEKQGTACVYMTSVVLQYFCGHSFHCRDGKPSDLLALAKRTVHDNYLVVGHVEQLSSFFEVLEVLLPHFFTNATRTLKGVEFTATKTKTRTKYDITPATRAQLENVMGPEYEFFNFVKQRFYNQLRKVRLLKAESAPKNVLNDITNTSHFRFIACCFIFVIYISFVMK